MAFVGKLICLDGPQRGREVSLDKDVHSVGRSPECDIVLDDKFASRVHASIAREGNAFTVADLGSKNGVAINHQRLRDGEKVCLEDGAVVSFARTRFRFEDPSATMTHMELERNQPLDTLHLHEATRQIWVNGRQLDPPLSLKQFDLLRCLYRQRGRAVSKAAIARVVWADEIGPVPESNIVRLVSRVRLRLAEAADGHQFISTVRGYGFRLDLPEREA